MCRWITSIPSLQTVSLSGPEVLLRLRNVYSNINVQCGNINKKSAYRRCIGRLPPQSIALSDLIEFSPPPPAMMVAVLLCGAKQEDCESLPGFIVSTIEFRSANCRYTENSLNRRETLLKYLTVRDKGLEMLRGIHERKVAKDLRMPYCFRLIFTEHIVRYYRIFYM